MNTGKLTEKAVEKAKEALGLNDTSVDAKLILNGQEYEIETFSIQFHKSFDYKGEPQREVKGGGIDSDNQPRSRCADEQLDVQPECETFGYCCLCIV